MRYDVWLEWAPIAIPDAALDSITQGVTLRSYEVGISISAKVETDKSATAKKVFLSFGFESVGKSLFNVFVYIFETFDDDFAVHVFEFTHGEPP